MSPSDDDNPPLALRDGMRMLALVVLIGAAIGLTITIAIPFLPALTWGVALTIIAWPLHRWIGKRVPYPSLAAALTTSVVVAVIVGCGLFITYQLAAETTAVTQKYQESTADQGIRNSLESVPLLSRFVGWMDRVGVDVEAEVQKLIGSSIEGASGFAQGSVSALIQFLVAVFVMFYLFVDRAEFLHGLRDLLPMSRAESDRVIQRAADTVHANLYATIITSVIDSVGGGLLFWWLGLPAPVVWAVAMFILGLLPIVGAALVWFPTAVYLALTDRTLAAAALMGWGLATFVIVDNFVYVRLAGERMRMHPVAALIAFLGGIAVFGTAGMILGPAIVGVTVALIDVWQRRNAAAGSPAIPASPNASIALKPDA